MRRKLIALLAVGFAALSGSVAENHREMQPPRDVSQALQDLEHRWVGVVLENGDWRAVASHRSAVHGQ